MKVFIVDLTASANGSLNFGITSATGPDSVTGDGLNLGLTFLVAVCTSEKEALRIRDALMHNTELPQVWLERTEGHLPIGKMSSIIEKILASVTSAS